MQIVWRRQANGDTALFEGDDPIPNGSVRGSRSSGFTGSAFPLDEDPRAFVRMGAAAPTRTAALAQMEQLISARFAVIGRGAVTFNRDQA